MRKSLFNCFFPDSADSDTIYLELSKLDCFHTLADYLDDYDIVGYNSTGLLENLFEFVRDFWDITYSYGEHDALIGEGVPLSELVD